MKIGTIVEVDCKNFGEGNQIGIVVGEWANLIRVTWVGGSPKLTKMHDIFGDFLAYPEEIIRELGEIDQ
jgi:hypothetical protein